MTLGDTFVLVGEVVLLLDVLGNNIAGPPPQKASPSEFGGVALPIKRTYQIGSIDDTNGNSPLRQ